jgi:hypothetical protein
MSSAIDLRKWPVPAIVPPVPNNPSLTSDRTIDDSNGPTCTGDKGSNFAARLPPYLRTRASKMRIKVAPVLHREIMPHSHCAGTDVAETDLKLICEKPARLRVRLVLLVLVERRVPVPVPVRRDGHGDSVRGGIVFEDIWMDMAG